MPHPRGALLVVSSLLLGACVGDPYVTTSPSLRRAPDAEGTDGGATAPAEVGAEGSTPGAPLPSDEPSAPSPTARGIFVAVGYGARRVRTRDDGASWENDQSDVPNGGDDRYLARDVAWGGGSWVLAAGFGGETKRSPDAATWTAVPGGVDQWFGGLAYAAGTWVGVGGYGRRSRSVDGGKTWADTRDTGAANGFRGLAVGMYQGAPRWVGVGDGGRVTFTSDGIAWSIGAGVPSSAALSDVAFGGGVAVAIVAGTQATYRSTDGGATWTAASLAAPARAIAFGQGRFVVVGDGRAMVSTDGATWSATPQSGLGGPVAFGNGRFLTLSGRRAYTSTDGATWTAQGQIPEGANAIERVRFGGQP